MKESIAGVAGRIAPATAASSTKLDFSSGVSVRRGVIITAYASPVYVCLMASAAADPSASSTKFDYYIPANSSLSLEIAKGVAVWVQTAGNVSALEVY